MSKPYEKLLIWQESDKLAILVYEITKKFPVDEKFGVTSQMRRAALSVPLNIVEGQARGTTKDHTRFLIQARGSLSELTYLLGFCLRQNLISEEIFKKMDDLASKTGYLLFRYIQSLKLPKNL